MKLLAILAVALAMLASPALAAKDIHPHMLRQACGFKLANDGHDTRHCSTISGTKTSNTR
jgi:site-specific recombinase XerD